MIPDAVLREELIESGIFVRRNAEAIRIADEAIADCPEAADHYLLLKAQAALEQGDLKSARATLESLPPNQLMTVKKFLISFNLALYERNYTEAERIVGMRPQMLDHELLVPDSFFQGTIERAQGHMEKAASSFSEARDGLDAQLRETPDIAIWISSQALADAALGRKADAL